MNAIKAEALRLRIEAERKAAQTPMLGAVTSGAQLAYIAGLQRDIGRGQNLTPKPAKALKSKELAAFEDWLDKTRPSGDVESVQHQWATSDAYADFLDAQDEPAQAEPAAITPDVLRAAFERAGVTEMEWLNHGGKWAARLVSMPSGDWQPCHAWVEGHNTPDRVRPGPSTPPDVLARFYRQWDAVEFGFGGRWTREDPEKGHFDGPASAYRLPADARLTRPL